MTATLHHDQFQTIAMQSLLPGLTLAAERAIEDLNEARATLKLAPVEFDASLVISQPESESPLPVQNLRSQSVRRPQYLLSEAARTKLRSAAKARWAIARQMGLVVNGRLPSAAEVEKALAAGKGRTSRAVASRQRAMSAAA